MSRQRVIWDLSSGTWELNILVCSNVPILQPYLRVKWIFQGNVNTTRRAAVTSHDTMVRFTVTVAKVNLAKNSKLIKKTIDFADRVTVSFSICQNDCFFFFGCLRPFF